MELSPKTKELRHDKRVQLNYNRGFEELQGGVRCRGYQIWSTLACFNDLGTSVPDYVRGAPSLNIFKSLQWMRSI